MILSSCGRGRGRAGVCGFWVAKLCQGSRAPGAPQAGAVPAPPSGGVAPTLHINILFIFELEKQLEAELCWVGSCCV